MRLEAVCICSSYVDFFAETADSLLAVVDDLVVVTTPDDNETKGYCKKRGIRCLATDVFTRDGETFNKAAGINYGLSHLRRDDWLMHVDADVWFPPMTRHHIHNAQLDKTCVYGIDRLNVVGWESWQSFLAQHKVEPQFEHSCLVKPLKTPHTPLGARILHMNYGGYVPIGFTQIWHSSMNVIYPMRQKAGAEHTDVLFSLQWPRPKRVLLPEVIAIHLESEAAPMGSNWRRRTTRRFGPASSNAQDGQSASAAAQYSKN